ncbi:MAG TPA: glycosyltransferase family 2 protein [Pseudonocardiaceae bacterium]|nr:glycosyltransferase family 2 protein [Pseudonocardiaceae bacterium]
MTFDIMLPYYGNVSLMQEAARSVLAQDDEDWRLTVVDDCYPDDAATRWFAGIHDDRVTYQRNEHNLGINRNFQKCVELAKHDHLVIIGADDLMLPHYLRTVRSVLSDHPDVEIVQPGVQIVNAAGHPTRSLVDETKQRVYRPRVTGTTVLSGERLAVSLLRGNWLYFPALCWQTKAIQSIGFRTGLDIIQDLALVIDLAQQGGSLAVADEVCFQYRRHPGSVSSMAAAEASRFVEERNYFLDVEERMRAHGWDRAARVAHRHLSSRLHALTRMPGSVRRRRSGEVRVLARHAFGPSTRVPTRWEA